MKRLLAFGLVLLLAASLLASIGCGPRRRSLENSSFSALNPLAASKTIDIPLSRKKLESTAMLGDTINTLRVIEVFRRGEEEGMGLPEYRLFDIQKGSAFEMVGLQNADVLQAANDHLIFQPDGFKVFILQVLPKLNTGSIRLIRGGVPIALNYNITE